MTTNNEVEAINDRIRKFATDRDWGQFHTPRNLAASVSIESAELLELFQWDKPETTWPDLESGDKRRRTQEELADVMIYALRFADLAGIDIWEAINQKMSLNEEKYPVEKVKGSSKKYDAY